MVDRNGQRNAEQEWLLGSRTDSHAPGRAGFGGLCRPGLSRLSLLREQSCDKISMKITSGPSYLEG